MSSRKMSLSGWRPARVTGASSTKRAPALGPRFTTSRPAPLGRSGKVMASSSSPASPCASTGCRVTVVSELVVPSTAPHDEQKLAPAGFRCPQLLQNTPSTLPRQLSGSPALAGGELAVGGGVEEAADGAGVVGTDFADPASIVRVGVEQFGGIGQVVVDRHHH